MSADPSNPYDQENEMDLEEDAGSDDEDIDVSDDDDEDLEDEDDHEDDAMNADEPPAPIEEDAALARRRAIQEIMRNTAMTQEDKNRAIQNLMSGGRTHVAPPAPPVLAVPEANAACVHYERNCNIVAPCCDRVFGCRICHDELSPTGHGPMNRFMIREVVCKNCNTRQPAGNQCITCQTVFGEYHCNICNLWMSMSKKPFHCAQCGFCRVGGVEAFRHCSECCMCISVSVFNTHQCFRDKYKNNCPVCREDMFSSRQSPQDLPCGHAIHAHCFRKLAGFDYRCPICKKTVVSQQSMAAAWEARARDIAEHPMPSDLMRIVDIMCNDCETKSANRDWHFLGIQCPRCNSFNTVVEQVVSAGPPQGQSGDATSGSA
ncbi:hypothetical protein MPSEU_000314500 [Mayamaea pseudoterrestris]|nr:hypothetical protein MPSEU_000314500 [Mayamaea pseudoterrestris]